MRIALVCERFEPGRGGVERVVAELARELGARGQDVTVVCRTAPAAPDGVPVRQLRVGSLWQPWRLQRFSRRARQETRDFDIVHGFTRTRHQHLYRAGGGSHAAYLERVYTWPALQRLSPRHRTILAIEEAVFLDAAQIIQCNSRLVAGELKRRYGLPDERLVTIYNGVDTVRFHPGLRAQRAAIRSELRLGMGPVALFAGSGFARKGLDRALAGLRASETPATLLVAGRGAAAPYRRQLQSLAADQEVRFLGERGDLERLYAAADLFVLPTRYDAFANACLEAMAAGLPVATTAANGASECLEPGVSGFVLEDFAAAFRALRDPGKLETMGRAARKTAERFSWARHADEVLALYRRLRP